MSKIFTFLLVVSATFFLNSCNSSTPSESNSMNEDPFIDDQLNSTVMSSNINDFVTYSNISTDNNTDNNTDNESQPYSVEIERIIENAPNPVGGVSIYNFHHYALNRVPFDNTDVEGATNTMGLSLNSVHPLFSESISGNVQHYYENGEKPSGTTTSVWDFMMNANGMPSTYIPSTEEDKFCIYVHRRYSLAQIATDAVNAIVNLGFVNSPDQWWLQVYEIFDDEGNYSQKIAPDYLLRDHPDSEKSKFADLARMQEAIQTQANEKWCVGYSQPMVVKLTKGSRPISEDNIEWPNQLTPYLDPIIKIPTITGYPHFTGSAYLDIAPDNASPNSVYLGIDILASLIDVESSTNTGNLNFDKKEYLHNSGYSALRLFWINFIKFDFSSGSADPFTVKMQEVIADKKIPLDDKMKILKKELKSLQYNTLMKELKNYPVNKFKGSVYGANFGTFKNIKKLANKFRKDGAIKTLKGLKLKSLKNILKGGGPESILNLAFSIWGLATTIANPGNPTQNILIYYIPDIMDGMTLFIDTTTKVNNFHLVSNIDGVVRTSYNTTSFPVDLFYEHINLKLENAAKSNKACFYNDPNDTIESYCFNSLEEYVTNAYVSSFTLPVNHWLKVEMKNNEIFYITDSFTQDRFSNSIASLLLNQPGIKLNLVDPTEVLESYSACFFLEDIFSGIAQCHNQGIYPINDINFWAKALDMEQNLEVLSTYHNRLAVQSIMINSEKDEKIIATLTDDRKFEVITDIPANIFDIDSTHYIEEIKIGEYELEHVDYPYVASLYCARLAWIDNQWIWYKTDMFTTKIVCDEQNYACDSGGTCYKWFAEDTPRCQIFEKESSSWNDFLNMSNQNTCLNYADNCNILNGDNCTRWIDAQPGKCQHLKHINNIWEWVDHPSIDNAQQCTFINQCSSGGTCFRWYSPYEIIHPPTD